jgi:drug/metabolite transporter (DMT)-like permease
MLGGFVWVIGDLFQQYAAKYVGISRGIPLSNTNQLWGLVWGILVFHELRGGSQRVYAEVIGGSILMALGAVAIASSSATRLEHARWRAAAEREGKRYGVGDAYVRAGMEGREPKGRESHRTFIDWLLVASVTAIFGALGAMARIPSMDINLRWAALVCAAMLLLLVGCALALWRATRFS